MLPCGLAQDGDGYQTKVSAVFHFGIPRNCFFGWWMVCRMADWLVIWLLCGWFVSWLLVWLFSYSWVFDSVIALSNINIECYLLECGAVKFGT